MTAVPRGGPAAVLRRLSERVLLEPEDLAPSGPDLEVVGVFNPGVAQAAGEVVLLARVAERPREEERGWTALPRVSRSGELVVDRVRDGDVERIDPRVVRLRRSGLIRLTAVSHLRVFRLGDGSAPAATPGGAFLPAGPLEEYGVEDPRITPLGGRHWFTYVAVSRHGVATALASTADFRSFERHGPIFCPENKDVVLFPERLAGGEYAALHRPVGATAFAPPEMWTARSRDLLRWGKHRPLGGVAGPGDAAGAPSGKTAAGAWQAARVGAGPPPLRTPRGWLAVYHGARAPAGPGKVGAYAAGALLLDEEAERVVARTTRPILVPERPWERRGFVPDVVFPTGARLREGTLLLYYGAADCRCAVVELALEEIFAALG